MAGGGAWPWKGGRRKDYDIYIYIYTWNPDMTSVLIGSLTIFWVVGGGKIEVTNRFQVYEKYFWTCSAPLGVV